MHGLRLFDWAFGSERLRFDSDIEKFWYFYEMNQNSGWISWVFTLRSWKSYRIDS